jgi:hypothetical protein
MIVTFYPPTDLKITTKKLSSCLQGFEWSKLPSEFRRTYGNKPRRVVSFELERIDRLELIHYCDFHEKSFTGAIMQALSLMGLYQ